MGKKRDIRDYSVERINLEVRINIKE